MNKFYIYPGNNSYLIKEGLLRRGNWQEETDESNAFTQCNFIWKPTNLTISEYIKLDGIAKTTPKNFSQVFNHFENIRGICTKTGLVRSLKKYYTGNCESAQVNYQAFDSTPTSFLITAGVEDTEYSNFVARYREIVRQSFHKESIPQKHCEGNYWLVKPANMNQGRGIEVFKNLKDINHFLSQKAHGSFWVVQKYIERPMLYMNRKFDLRIWVVVTEKNEIFLYNKAYLRTSSDGYDLNTSKNYVHLTNNCLQKHGDNYGKHEDGNTLALSKLDEYFKTLYPQHDVNLAAHVIPRIRDLIIDTFLCTKKTLNPAKRKGVFELFGYDFLIDEDMRTWLIEVNTNPYLGIPNKYIAEVLPQMIDDMMELVVDPLFPSQTNPRSEDRANGYDLIYCEYGSAHHNGPLSLRTPFTKNVYPIQALVPADFWKKLTISEKNQEPMQNFDQQSSNKLALAKKNNSEEEEQNQEEGNAEKARASSADGKTKGVARSNIEAIHKQLINSIMNKIEVNANVTAVQIKRIFSCLQNWELVSKRDIKLACKSLTLIAQSSGDALLTEQANILTIVKLLRSNDVTTEIKFSVIETINILSKDVLLRKRLICNHLFQNLITLCLSSCDEKEIQNHNSGFLMATLKCLTNLGGSFNRKFFVPGEARETAKLRSFFMAQGGIIAVWIISQKSLDANMREYCTKNFLNFLEVSDYEKQLQILDLVMTMPNVPVSAEVLENRVKTEGDVEEASEKKKDTSDSANEAIFFKTGEFWMIEKALGEKNEQNEKGLEKIINFTKEMLDLVPLETLRKDFGEHVSNWKAEWEKRETKEKEKRQMAEAEKLKKEESRKKELEEQRKQALEGFEKRVKDNLKKQQMDIERRQKEIEEMKLKEVEARKKNIENLMTKKAEREKKRFRTRVIKQESKRNDLLLEDSKDNKEEAKRQKVDQELTSAELKRKSLGNSTEPVSATELNTVAVNEGTEAKNLELRSDSHRQSLQNVNAQYFMSPTGLTESPKEAKTVHYLTSTNMKAETKFKQVLSESLAITKGRGRERLTGTDSFKLPKIQKTGRVIIGAKMSQSPYMRELETLNPLKSKGKKDNKENMREKV